MLNMKVCCLILGLIAVSWALPKEAKYVPGEFMLRVDERFVNTEAKRAELADYLKLNFNFELLSSSKVGKLQFMRLKGDEEHLERINSLPGVKYIERNTLATLFQTCEQHPAPGVWGLDRVDQREQLPYSDPSSPDATYIHGLDTGTGVAAYVIDTGIEIEHSEFIGRARWGYSSPGLPDEDNHSHGTHCAGTVGGTQYGVAKDVELVAVKVINRFGSGTAEDFVLGMDWILSDHQARSAELGVTAKSVVSISLGYDPTQSIDDSVQELVDGGIVVVAAAGNNDFDASGISPARAPATITVGASNVNDVSAYFSNYGPVVDLYAPGVDVLSAVPGDGTSIFSGTSMACPHVAGAVARYQSSLESAPHNDDVKAWLREVATPDALTWFNDRHSTSDNLLLYSEC